MGYWMLIARCLRCRRPFSVNPEKVPSVPVRWEGETPIPDPDGTREPLCRPCADLMNAVRVEQGLEPLRYAEDAYQPGEFIPPTT